MGDGSFVSDEELWALRYRLRRELIEFARRRLQDQEHRSKPSDFIAFDHLLNPDALTIGFARRFATYKRAPLVFDHLENLVSPGPRPAAAGAVCLRRQGASARRRGQAVDPKNHPHEPPLQAERASGVPRKLRRTHRPADGVRLRHLAEQSAPAARGVRHERHESHLPRLPQPQHL